MNYLKQMFAADDCKGCKKSQMWCTCVMNASVEGPAAPMRSIQIEQNLNLELFLKLGTTADMTFKQVS